MASSSPPAPRLGRVLALFGPTASGKTAVAGILRERLGAEVISADSAALYARHPDPHRRSGLPGAARRRRAARGGRLGRRVPAARARGDRRAARASPLVVGGTGPLLPRGAVGARASAAAGAAPRALASRGRRGSAPRRRTRCSRNATRPRPRACTRTTAAASSARSSSPRRAHRSRRRRPALDRRHAPPDDDRRARRAARRARPPHRGAHARDGGGRGGGGGAGGLGTAALRDGTEGARPRGVRDPAAWTTPIER